MLYASFGPDIKKFKIIQNEDSSESTKTTTIIGLNIAHKVYAICGNNAPNNDTFCDHFHSKLLAIFNDDPNREMDISRCLFRGRASRIGCLAHICSLIAEAVFKHFIPGSREEAQKLVNDVANGPRGTGFAENCARLSVYMKIKTLVL